MGSNLNFYVSTAVEEWRENVRHCVYLTDVDCHLYAVVSIRARYPRQHWVLFREVPRLHAYSWYFAPSYTLEQQEPGETRWHTFDIPDWRYCMKLYWYLFGYRHGLRSPSTSPLFEAHYEGPEAEWPPEPIPVPVLWTVENPIFRTGNHYSFWAYKHWWCMVPAQGRLTMWQYRDGSMHHVDEEHDPIPGLGVWADADARLDITGRYIHVAAFLVHPYPQKHQVRYYLFDLETRLWDLPRLIVEPRNVSGQKYSVNITVSNILDPAFYYTEFPGSYAQIHAIVYYEGNPRVPARVLDPAYRQMWYSTAAYDPTSNAIIAAGVDNAYSLHARWTDGLGYWSMLKTFTDQSVNQCMHAVSGNLDHWNIGSTARYWGLNYHRYIPPWDSFPSIVPPSTQYANCITPVGIADHLLLPYRAADARLAIRYRDPDLKWHESQYYEHVIYSNLAATHAEPDVTSYLYRPFGPGNCALFAAYDPWAS